MKTDLHAFADRKCFADALSDAVIGALPRIKNKRLDFQDVCHAPIADHRLFGLDVRDLTNELCMEPDFQSMDQPALDDDREFLYVSIIGLKSFLN